MILVKPLATQTSAGPKWSTATPSNPSAIGRSANEPKEKNTHKEQLRSSTWTVKRGQKRDYEVLVRSKAVNKASQ